MTIDASGALRIMLTRSGESPDRLSVELHRSRNWLRNSLGADPMLSTVASVAGVTGCEVVIRDAISQEVIAIVAPPDPAEHKRSGPTKSAGESA